MPRVTDIKKIRDCRLVSDPFPYQVVPGFVKAKFLSKVINDFPKIEKPGSFPLGILEYGEAFAALVKELEGGDFRDVASEMFGVDLTSRPTMITARGICRAKDGQIHTDSRSKIITVLLYLNAGWESSDGCLRLLRSPDSLDDMLAEISPSAGTMLAFLNTENAWHGHSSFEGVRRVIQLNWVTDQSVVEREQKRHRLSAFFKKVSPF